MKIDTKTNGYTAQGIQPMITRFENAAQKLFPDATMSHFYYGDHLDMIDIILEPGRYAHFDVSANRVSLCGYTCSADDLDKFGSLTYRDECYDGNLLEIAE